MHSQSRLRGCAIAEGVELTFYSKTPILSTLREDADQTIPPKIPPAFVRRFGRLVSCYAANRNITWQLTCLLKFLNQCEIVLKFGFDQFPDLHITGKRKRRAHFSGKKFPIRLS